MPFVAESEMKRNANAVRLVLFGLRYRLSLLDHNFELLDANLAVRAVWRMVGWWRFLTLALPVPSPYCFHHSARV